MYKGKKEYTINFEKNFNCIEMQFWVSAKILALVCITYPTYKESQGMFRLNGA